MTELTAYRLTIYYHYIVSRMLTEFTGVNLSQGEPAMHLFSCAKTTFPWCLVNHTIYTAFSPIKLYYKLFHIN